MNSSFEVFYRLKSKKFLHKFSRILPFLEKKILAHILVFWTIKQKVKIKFLPKLLKDSLGRLYL